MRRRSSAALADTSLLTDSLPLVSLHGVCVRFPTTTGVVNALRHVNLSLEAGTSLGVVGESGSGKTTLGRVIAGVQKVDAGTVHVAPSTRPLGQRIGVVFQDPSTSLNPRLSVRQILRDPFVVHKIGDASERERRIDLLLQQVGLPLEIKRRRARQLSGGQLQRVAIARAMALDPDIVIADEPTSALDLSVRAQVLNTLQQARARRSFALLLISHDLRIVRSLCDRVVVMYSGVIVEEGTVGDVMQGPRHPYTQLLVESLPSLEGGRRRRISGTRSEGPIEDAAVARPDGCPFAGRCSRALDECWSVLPDESTMDRRAIRCHNPIPYHVFDAR